MGIQRRSDVLLVKWDPTFFTKPSRFNAPIACGAVWPSRDYMSVLEHGASISEQGGYQRTALQFRLASGHAEAAEELFAPDRRAFYQ
jgi:hypothetical protein